MCLAVPMRIVELLAPTAAEVDLDGNRLRVDVSLVDAPAKGDYVIVHAGFAIQKLDTEEADARLALFEELAALQANAAAADAPNARQLS